MIKISGGTRIQKKYTKSIVEFCIQKLMPRIKDLDIVVKLKKFKTDDSYGYCLPTDDVNYDRPRSFEIEINRDIKLRRLLETVAHEMVHVKQFARGELYQGIRVNKFRWQGSWIDEENVNYWDHPWEIEAHGRELGLFIRWVEQENLAKESWTQEN